MSSESIRLSSHLGKIFEASEYMPWDIAEETREMDKLNGGKVVKQTEPISQKLDQEQLMMLCDELKRSDISTESREVITELLSSYGLKVKKSSGHDAMYIEEETDVDDIPVAPRFLTIEEIMDVQAARGRTAKHISKL